MKLGRCELNKPVFMAPMAGITDKAFREIIRRLGGKYVFTEMISDKALIYHNSKTIQMLDLKGEEEPRIVQIFGSEPDTMAQAAQIALEHGADVIDINMGCPTPKIVKNNEGAALLRDLRLAEKIASRVVKAVDVPVTVKMRLGWDGSSIVAPELAVRLEAVGIHMVTVHARTREQYYSGQADWKWLAKIKEKITIPVIGNGDVRTPQDGLRLIQETGCDGIMIARGSLGNPWLIGRTQHYLETGELLPEPGMQQKLEILLAHFQKIISYKGESIGLNEIRKHAAWYTKGLKNSGEFRNKVMTIDHVEEMELVFRKFFFDQGNDGAGFDPNIER